jgi:bifunctional DNase/RNase
MRKMLNVEIWTIVQTAQGKAVLLRPLGSDISVPIFIGSQECQPILIALSGVSFPRPLTHDLLLTLIHQLRIELTRAEIYDIKDNTVLARLYFEGNGYAQDNPLILDSRPSDALALALRCNCPVFVSGKVAADVGVPADVFINAIGKDPEADFMEESEISEKNLHRLALRAELEAAVANEEYERAAEIRDALILPD